MEIHNVLYDFIGLNENDNREFLMSVLTNLKSNSDIIDLATGYASHVNCFINKNRKIVLVDRCEDCINYLKDNYRDSNVKIIHSDIQKIRLDDKFDIVHLGDNTLNMFPTYKDVEAVIKSMSLLLKDSGRALINLTPLTTDIIRNYNLNDKILAKEFEEDNIVYKLYTNIEIDVFRSTLLMFYYLYNDNDEVSRFKINCRIIVEDELLSIADSCGLILEKKYVYKSSNKKISYYYAFIRK